MSQNVSVKHYAAVIAMLVALAGSYALDRWTQYLVKFAMASFEYRSYALGVLVANLATASAWLILSWLAIFSLPRSRLVAIIYLVVGAILMLFPITTYFFADFPLFSQPPWRELRMRLLEAGLETRFLLTSAFVAIAGLVGLFIPYKSPA